MLVSWPNPTVLAGFLFKPVSSQFSWSSVWQRSAGTAFLLFKVRRKFAEGNNSSVWVSGENSKSSKCHTLILQGHMQSSVLCEVKHVITLFAKLGPVLWNCSRYYCKCLTWVLFKTSWLWLSKQAIEKTRFLANRKACCHWGASFCQETACAKTSIWQARNPRLNSDLGSLSANILCDWSHCWSYGCYLVFILVGSWYVFEVWDSPGKAR